MKASPGGSSYIGVMVQEIDGDRAKELKLREEYGVEVTRIEADSPAEKAGMKAGDVIVKVDDSSVSTTAEVTRALRGLRSRKNFNVTVVRNKKEMPLTVTMDERGGIRAAVKVVDC